MSHRDRDKICTSCGEMVEIGWGFKKNRRTKDGYTNVCKFCIAQKTKMTIRRNKRAKHLYELKKIRDENHCKQYIAFLNSIRICAKCSDLKRDPYFEVSIMVCTHPEYSQNHWSECLVIQVSGLKVENLYNIKKRKRIRETQERERIKGNRKVKKRIQKKRKYLDALNNFIGKI